MKLTIRPKKVICFWFHGQLKMNAAMRVVFLFLGFFKFQYMETSKELKQR
jgi:hypothetical protein